MHSMNHAAGAEEHQSLEEGVCHHMEYAYDKRTDAASHEHETELRHSRVCQHLLDIVLSDPDRSSEDGGCRSYQSHHQHHCFRVLENDVRPSDHVQPGSNHCRGVNQRGHRSWTGHRIAQPNVQWQLRGLAAGSDEQSERNPRKNSPVTEDFHWERPCLCKYRRVLCRAKGRDDGKDGERKSEVTNTIRDESFS